MINGYREDLDFELQEGAPREWRRVIDTSRDSPLDFVESGDEASVDSPRYRVAARSVVVLTREPAA